MRTSLKLLCFSVGSAFLFTNCVDSDRNLFDKDQAAGLYEENFPVQNIDPNMDWNSFTTASANIGITEDEGVNYRIRIFDEYPLIENSNAKLLAEGIANNQMAFTTTFNLPKAMDVVYVVRTDEKNRHTVKVVGVNNNAISVNFTNASIQTRSGNTGDFTIIPENAPYTDSEVQSMLNSATEIEAGWDLGALSNWENGKYKDIPVFATPNNEMRYFKITTPQTNIIHATGGATMRILIASKLTLTSAPSTNGTIEYIVLNGGEIELNAKFEMPETANITVLHGGKITGTGTLIFSNASNGAMNYNGGEISIEEIELKSNNPYFYNAGALNLEEFVITNAGGRFVNMGKAIIEDISHYNTTVENGCFLEVEDFSGILNAASNSYTNIQTYNKNRYGAASRISGNSILHIENAYLNGGSFINNSNNYGLIKIESIKGINNFNHSGKIYYEVQDVSSITDTHQKGFLEQLKNTEGQLSQFGDSPIYIEPSDCTGKGNRPNDMGEDIIDVSPIKFTYAYEDNFPQVGDYDFNDIVLDVTTAYTKDATNNIKKIHYHVTLAALGSTKKIGAALRLIGINKNDITSIEFDGDTHMRNTLSGSVFENATTEASDNNYVIPLFGDAHAVYGGADDRKMLNTNTLKTSEIYTLEVILTLADQTKTSPLLSKDNLDFFIAYQIAGNKRTEVHLYEFINYGATANGNVHKENQEAAGNCTWAVCVPEFKYPRESITITEAYPKFEAWAQNQDTNQDWYNNPTDKTDKKYIY